MASKKEYYRLDNALSLAWEYLILLGEKSNGKSYAVKEFVIKDYLENGHKFVYMRRHQLDCKMSDVIAYFADAPVEKLTHGKYNCINVYQGNIFLSKHDNKTNKYKNGDCIGRYVYLIGYHHFASQAFPDVYNIIYEEFVTDGSYLNNEPALLQRFVSTILRDRNGKVILCGNTINRVCPYFGEWSLSKVMKQKQGTIDIYEFHSDGPDGEDKVTRVAVELCNSSKSPSTMFFGQAQRMIQGGKWETHEYPKLPDDIIRYKQIYELLLSDCGFEFELKLMMDPKSGGLFVYIIPHWDVKIFTRIITDEFSVNPFVTSGFMDNKAEKMMRSLLYDNKVCYYDNLTGEDFTQTLKNKKNRL